MLNNDLIWLALNRDHVIYWYTSESPYHNAASCKIQLHLHSWFLKDFWLFSPLQSIFNFGLQGQLNNSHWGLNLNLQITKMCHTIFDIFSIVVYVKLWTPYDPCGLHLYHHKDAYPRGTDILVKLKHVPLSIGPRKPYKW
jgi:hypothetical protein